MKYKINDEVIVVNCTYAIENKCAGFKAKIIEINNNNWDYRVRFADGAADYFKEYELESIKTEVIDSKLITLTPTFNVAAMPCGSLVHINKGYLQLQGFVQKITSTELSLAYYDEISNCANTSIETVNIDDIVSGQQTIELIRKAVPLR